MDYEKVLDVVKRKVGPLSLTELSTSFNRIPAINLPRVTHVVRADDCMM